MLQCRIDPCLTADFNAVMPTFSIFKHHNITNVNAIVHHNIIMLKISTAALDFIILIILDILTVTFIKFHQIFILIQNYIALVIIKEFSMLIERVRIIEIDLITPTCRYEVSSRYDVSRKSKDEISWDKIRDSDKKSHYSDSRGSGLIASMVAMISVFIMVDAIMASAENQVSLLQRRGFLAENPNSFCFLLKQAENPDLLANDPTKNNQQDKR
ncbi:hypothetical protein IEQ34_016962 [Dendrobium chrysotoxum]|uniref:Uncharacterized protein n=1 Tax=Dendrobium chrysotoxum TaxID=161865 RepID=A0AAV7GH44_DENCH|nr:hypothetical protein IEQ34_016962 [Dendrobium chrysotoxum]